VNFGKQKRFGPGLFFFFQLPLSDRLDGQALLLLHVRSAEKAILYVFRRFNLTATERIVNGQTPSWSCPSRLDLIESRTVLLERTEQTFLYLMGTSLRPHKTVCSRRLFSIELRHECWRPLWISSQHLAPRHTHTHTEGETTVMPNLTSQKSCHGRAEFTFDCRRLNIFVSFTVDRYVVIWGADFQNAFYSKFVIFRKRERKKLRT